MLRFGTLLTSYPGGVEQGDLDDLAQTALRPRCWRRAAGSATRQYGWPANVVGTWHAELGRPLRSRAGVQQRIGAAGDEHGGQGRPTDGAKGSP